METLKLPSKKYRDGCKHHDHTSGRFNFQGRGLTAKEKDEAEHVSNHSINSHAAQLASVLCWLMDGLLTLEESRQFTKILSD